jgi:hypothetical protein
MSSIAARTAPLGVVLLRDRCAPDGHYRIPDELLDSAAVALNHRPRLIEVAREELPDLLGVARFRERREAHEIGEEDRHEPALRGSCLVGQRGDARRHR